MYTYRAHLCTYIRHIDIHAIYTFIGDVCIHINRTYIHTYIGHVCKYIGHIYTHRAYT